MKAIVIDDEALARQLVKEYLQSHTNIQVVAECQDGFEGVKAIRELQPDLVFLDIQMPRLNGFEMLELLDFKPMIIFTTAYDEFAIRAFEMNTADYLLKPFSQARFDQAIEKAHKKVLDLPSREETIAGLQTFTDQAKERLERVIIKKGDQLVVIPVVNINYIESYDDYVWVHAQEGKFLKQKTMQYFEDKLDPARFIRIHRSYIVNVAMIDKIHLLEKESWVVSLKSGARLKASKAGYKRLRELL